MRGDSSRGGGYSASPPSPGPSTRCARSGPPPPRGRGPLGASPSPSGRRWRAAPDEGKDLLMLDFHRELIADEIRTRAFRDAIHSIVTPESIVLDLGCGSGILSFFACQAGARRV